jgi:hypothetical protein
MEPESTVTEMEARLMIDESGEYRDALIALLEGARHHVDVTINQGLPADSFETTSKLKQGLEAAEQTVRQYWSRFHAS